MRALVYRQLPPDVGDFRLISRPCLDAVSQMRETHRFLRGMVAWVGFPQAAVAYRRQRRVAGVTKYPLRKMLAFSWIAATSFSTLPLRLSMIFGAMVGMLGIEEGIRAALAHFLGWYTVPGWTSLTVLVSLIGSALLISIGILGEYVAKLYEQSKGRPLYIVARTFGRATPSPNENREWDAAVHSNVGMTPFDQLSPSYEELLRDPIRDRFTGQESGFFHRRKADLIRRFFRRRGVNTSDLRYLDVGCGKGELLGLLQSDFKQAAGCDVSEGMMRQIAGGSKPGFKKTLCRFRLATPNSIW